MPSDTLAPLIPGPLGLVAGIILYNTDMGLLRRCLRALQRQQVDRPEFRVRLAFLDNNQGRDLPALRELLEDLELSRHVAFVESGENVGFGAGHNRIFQALEDRGHSFEYYLCVNPDAILHRDCIAELVSFARSRNDAGIFEGRQFPREHPKPYDPETFETPWCSGCLLMLPRQVYKNIEGFDSGFFMYCEDVDLSWRVRLAGLKCYSVPKALVHHYVYRSERDGGFERKHMLLSGYRLAQKYSKPGFAAGVLDELRAVLPAEELSALVAQTIPTMHPDPAGAGIPDFDHGFYFAAPRW